MRAKLLILLFFCMFVLPSLLRGKNNEQKQSYQDKAIKDLKIENKNVIDMLYKNEININKSNEFKKVGIDLKKIAFKLAGEYDFREHALMAQLVIIGSIEERNYDLRKGALFQSSYQIKVKKILIGKDIYKKLAPKITVLRMSGYNVKTSSENFADGFDIGEDYVFFLTRQLLNQIYEGRDSLKGFVLPDEKGFADENVFTELPYSTLHIKDRYLYNSYGRIKPSYDLFENTVTRIGEINDRKNFRNRRYAPSEERIK